jgi:hypothetical protein
MVFNNISLGTGRVINTGASIQFNSGGFFGAGGTPEPSTFGLVGLGIAVVAFRLRKARGSPP